MFSDLLFAEIIVLQNPKITEHKSTFVEKNSSNDQYDQHLNIDLKATESNFKKLVVSYYDLTCFESRILNFYFTKIY